MKKICWITGDNFLDVDIPIVKKLAYMFDIDWYVIFSKNRIVSFTEKSINEDFKKKNIRINYIYLSERYRSLNTLFCYVSMLHCIDKANYELIYCNFLGIPYFFFIAYFMIDRSKLIYAIHDFIDHKKIPNRKFIQLYKKFIFVSFNNFQFFSKTQQLIFKKEFSNKSNFYSPLFLKDFGKPTTIQESNKINFLFFGIIRKNKGLEFLIEAGNRLAIRYKERFIITIAGTCDNWAYYEEKIQNSSIFDLQIGPVRNSEIPNLYVRSHYLVLPYLDVTQSGPLLIAYNYKVPVIASSLKGFEEYIINNKNGYLFESESADALYQVLEKIIKTQNKGYKKLKKNLDLFVEENISLESISIGYKNFFDSL